MHLHCTLDDFFETAANACRNLRAEAELQHALESEPENFDFQYGLADHYIKTGQLLKAMRLAEQMVATHPDNPAGGQISTLSTGPWAGNETHLPPFSRDSI